MGTMCGMPHNIELKARLPDFPGALEIAAAAATADLGTLRQVDTYFHTPTGRLKLREIDGGRAELIGYRRPDRVEARQSDYQIVEISAADALKQVLAATLGIRCVVDKVRRVFLSDNVRIHLDRVEDLGEFIEFEAVLSGEIGADRGRQQVRQLRELFKISPSQLIDSSYSDLITSARWPAQGADSPPVSPPAD